MTRRSASHAAYAHLIALMRLRAVVRLDVWPREAEPLDLIALLIVGRGW